MKGWVYIISNRGMPGLIKIGYSSKDPELRAKELDGTGAPHPYEVDYEILVPDPYLVEQAAHVKLSDKKEAKEWFRASLDDGVLAIRSVADGKIQVENFIKADKEIILVEERIQLEKTRKEEADKKRKEAVVKRREEEEAKRARRDEELRIRTDRGKREKFNNFRPVVRQIIDKCSTEHGLIFKTKKFHPSYATTDELFKFFWFICEENGVESVVDIKDLQSKAWWDADWDKDCWLQEAYKRIAQGKVENDILEEFVRLVSGHTVGGPNARSIWRLRYSNCKEAIDYLKKKNVRYRSLNYDNPR